MLHSPACDQRVVFVSLECYLLAVMVSGSQETGEFLSTERTRQEGNVYFSSVLEGRKRERKISQRNVQAH